MMMKLSGVAYIEGVLPLGNIPICPCGASGAARGPPSVIENLVRLSLVGARSDVVS